VHVSEQNLTECQLTDR